jgi:hypothetical protein
MPGAASTLADERLPVNQAILANVGLSLFMWNMALQFAALLLSS